ncbi:carboxypeptidase B-like [Corticium candelabrum]|uniref:carboxypeptidase B-like n=1 Tax=Corticium candelabrum TaxID=121492 RepID=UPI002E26AD76|nr:carboxypeptidase B-like [Corticium candelabrum]
MPMMTVLKWACVLSLVSLVASQTRTVTYTGERVLHCVGPAPHVVEASELLHDPAVDVWAVHADGSIDIRVMKHYDEMKTQLEKIFQQCHLVIPDLEDFMSQMEQNERKQAVNSSLSWFEEYHTYDEIIGWYQELSSEYSELVKYEVIGLSGEDRVMPAIRIGAENAREKIYFQCQIHAREWISGAVCMYVVDYLVSSYGEVEEVTSLLEKLQILVVPFANPDGYQYTWTDDRMWRKNRAMNEGSSCRGVDLNRNYNDHWNEGGSSSNPCSETYHGHSAESEPETHVVCSFFRDNGPIIGAIDWHSYSQLILRPYGWTSEDSPDESLLKELGDGMSRSAYNVHGMQYSSQKSIGLYPATGTASDWFYGTDATSTNNGYRAAGFTIELRDTGYYGFLLPANQIVFNGQEMVAAVEYFLNFCLNNAIVVTEEGFN